MAIKAQQESFLAVITTFCIFLYEDQCPAVILCCSFARCFTWENWMKGIQDLFLLFLATACQSIITSKNYFNLKSNKGTHYQIPHRKKIPTSSFKNTKKIKKSIYILTIRHLFGRKKFCFILNSYFIGLRYLGFSYGWCTGK